MADRDELDWQRKNEPQKFERNIPEKEKKFDRDSLEQGKTASEDNNWFMSLTKIKGIGKETAIDISRAFPSQDALVGALKDDTAPFRNDIVRKLNKYFQLSKYIMEVK